MDPFTRGEVETSRRRIEKEDQMNMLVQDKERINGYQKFCQGRNKEQDVATKKILGAILVREMMETHVPIEDSKIPKIEV